MGVAPGGYGVAVRGVCPSPGPPLALRESEQQTPESVGPGHRRARNGDIIRTPLSNVTANGTSHPPRDRLATASPPTWPNGSELSIFTETSETTASSTAWSNSHNFAQSLTSKVDCRRIHGIVMEARNV